MCDSIDAMLSNRSYRKAMPFEVCRAEIEKNVGIMYDPRIARAALDNWELMIERYK